MVSRSCNTSDKACVGLPSTYKLVHFEQDDHDLLFRTYKCMYPKMKLDKTVVWEVGKRFRSIILSSERFGSKLDSRSTASGKIMASWVGANGDVDASASVQLGEVKLQIVLLMKAQCDI